MNIKKSLSAIMSMSMLLTSAAYVPLGNVYAEDDGYYDQSADYYAEANGDYEEVLVGTMNFRAPKKVIYRVGEEFDVTGGYCSGSGGIIHRTKDRSYSVGNWDNFGREYTIDELDLSGFDNTKAGVYEILPAASKNKSRKDEIQYTGFKVMVIGDEKTEDNYVAIVGKYNVEAPINPILSVGESVEDHYFGGDLHVDWDYEFHHDGKVDIFDGKKYSVGINEYDFDFSEVDTTKPGIYKVTPNKIEEVANVDRYDIDYGFCYVMVTEGEPTDEDKKKINALNEGREEEVIKKEETPAVTTADVDVEPVVTAITTTGFGHNDRIINETDLVVASVSGNTITVEDGRKFDYSNGMSPDIAFVKKGDVIAVQGAYHCVNNDDNYGACSGTFSIIKRSEEEVVTTTTAVTTVSTNSTTSIIYTGDQAFEFLDVNTYPTQTVFMEGEEINTEGLNLKIRRYIPYESLGYDRKDFAEEPAFDSEKSFSPVDIDIVDENDKVYNGTQFSKLPAGKYVAVIKGDYRVWQDVQNIIDVDIAFEVEIKKDSRNLLPGNSAPTDKEILPELSKYYQDFKGVAVYPDKTLYKKGEELDLTGLIIKAQRHDNGLTSSKAMKNYEENPVYLKTVLPDAEIFRITDEKGNTVKGDEFSTLPVGKYTVSCRSAETSWQNFSDWMYDVNFSYDIEISDKDTSEEKVSKIVGDANLDETIDISDSVYIMQTLANPAKYKFSQQSQKNADIDGAKDGVTNKDALHIQKMLLKLI